ASSHPLAPRSCAMAGAACERGDAGECGRGNHALGPGTGMSYVAECIRAWIQAEHRINAPPMADAASYRTGHAVDARVESALSRHRPADRLRRPEPFHQDFRGQNGHDTRSVAKEYSR